MAYPNEHFKSIDDYRKPADKLKKENFFSIFKIACPIGEKNND